jgi:hypothetical protein
LHIILHWRWSMGIWVGCCTALLLYSPSVELPRTAYWRAAMEGACTLGKATCLNIKFLMPHKCRSHDRVFEFLSAGLNRLRNSCSTRTEQVHRYSDKVMRLHFSKVLLSTAFLLRCIVPFPPTIDVPGVCCEVHCPGNACFQARVIKPVYFLCRPVWKKVAFHCLDFQWIYYFMEHSILPMHSMLEAL